MREETLLNQSIGKKNPFVVPEGYFDDFEKRLLADMQLGVKPQRGAFVRRLRPALWAACASAAAICGAVYMAVRPAAVKQADRTAATSSSYIQYNADMAIDQASDFAMLDNGDFYSYVSGE